MFTCILIGVVFLLLGFRCFRIARVAFTTALKSVNKK